MFKKIVGFLLIVGLIGVIVLMTRERKGSVTWSIYSGRENPVLELDEGQLTEIQTILMGLPAPESGLNFDKTLSPDLGDSRFDITYSPVQNIFVKGEQVIVIEWESVEIYYVDESHQLENFLLGIFETEMDVDEYRVLFDIVNSDT